VNLVTKKPLATPLYAFEASIGNYDFYSGSVDFSGPLDAGKTVLYRLNASILDSKSFVNFIENDRYFVAPSFTWLIGDKTSLTFTGEYQYSRYPNERGLPKIGTITDNPNGSIPRSRFLGEPSFDQRNSEIFRVGYDLEHRFSQNWSVGNAFLTVVEQTQQYSTAAVRLLPDNQTLERTSFFDVGEVERGSFALDTKVTGKFSTGSVQHKLLFGVDLSRTFGGNNYIERKIGSINIFNPVYNQIPGDVVSRFDSNTFTNALGLYVQDEISLLDSLILVLSGRFDIVDQRVENYLNRANDTTQQNDAFSPQVGIVYKPIEPISIYASFARSFQPITGTTLEGNLFQPEWGSQYEISIKADIHEKLSGTLAFYDLTRSNVTTPDPRNTRFSIQTGEQNSQGIELDIAGEILPGWNIIASYAYTDAKVTKDTRTTLVDNTLNNVPEHSFSLWTTYELLKGNLKGLGFGLGFFYIGERQGDLNNTFTLPSYLRTDAAIFYKKNDLRVALNFKNLFGIDYFESADSDLRVFPGSPFTVQGSVSWQF
jgi:iron complex outermembrane receptor protein